MRDALRQRPRDWSALEGAAMASLRARGWQPDYVAIRRRADLAAPADAGERWSCSRRADSARRG
jgi:pantoate--beta-alanine ligase